jgi:hypothetical protein
MPHLLRKKHKFQNRSPKKFSFLCTFKEWGTVFLLKVGFKGWVRRKEPSEGIVHGKEDPIYLFPEMKLRFLPHSCICERFIYSRDLSTYFAAVWLGKGLDDGFYVKGWLA